MKWILSCLVALAFSLGLAWAVEAPVPESSTPAEPPALDFAVLFGAQPVSEVSIQCLGPAGYTCTQVTTCDPVRLCSNETGTGPVRTDACRCCKPGVPGSCFNSTFSVSCGC